jgi:adenylate cyclase
MVAIVERVLGEQRLRAEQARIRELIADDAMAQMIREVRLGKKGVARTESMTLLFSDLKGFSTMCSALSAEEVVDLLNGYFDAMIPPIRETEGDVDKFIGDAIMARFRDPDDGVEREPSPLRAIRAGLGMIRALEAYNEGLPGDTELHMRIGINHGEVVIGAIGASSRRDYTTIGDNVNRAQRLESNASVDGVLIAESTYQMVKDRVKVKKRRKKVALKGIPEPVNAYDVLGIVEEEG